MTNDIKCPRCGLINPAVAEKCDCGYDFATRTVADVRVPYEKRTKRDNVYLAVVLCGPFLMGAVAGGWLGGSAGGRVAVFLFTWGVLLYEIRMYRLTPRLSPKRSLKEQIYIGVAAVLWFFGFGGVVASTHGKAWAAPWLALSLVLAVRNYRTRRAWDRLEKPTSDLQDK